MSCLSSLTISLILTSTNSNSIDTADVTEKIKQIFEGHLDLIKDFDRFLPPGYSDADESGEKRDNDDDSEDSGTASPGGGQYILLLSLSCLFTPRYPHLLCRVTGWNTHT